MTNLQPHLRASLVTALKRENREGVMGFGHAVKLGRIGRWVLVSGRNGAQPGSVRVCRKDMVEDGGVGG
ncbi:hypothetical protein C1H46_020274 [Malus baccata]|uniref:Uncharacterized protein n=1 Tax=Malus baccata TaxID=106549 RepID=A0A540M6E7_MALBA|nr:hypothetical protein C1H46_020274 [Malus baccata]